MGAGSPEGKSFWHGEGGVKEHDFTLKEHRILAKATHDMDRSDGGGGLLPEPGVRPPCCKGCRAAAAPWLHRGKSGSRLARGTGGSGRICHHPERWDGRAKDDHPPCYEKPHPPPPSTRGFYRDPTPRKTKRAINRVFREHGAEPPDW